ncbi:MAG TPA: four helix bundle protein [Candidatus Paceibacterota bacterium]
MARSERFGIGNRIDSLWLDLLDALRRATYASVDQKILLLGEVAQSVDAVRFFLLIAWESKLMAQSHFISLGKDVEEIGRMVGGWRKGLLTKTPAEMAGERRE